MASYEPTVPSSVVALWAEEPGGAARFDLA
jgi:hypothetical protein